MDTIDEAIAKLAATPDSYAGTADALTKRILETFERHPEAATITSPYDLFKVEGFNCDDLEPSLFQASWALAQARKAWASK